MHVPPAFQRSDDIALLRELADPVSDAVVPSCGDLVGDQPDGCGADGSGVGGSDRGGAGGDVVLDGRRPAYLVARGRVEVFAVRRGRPERRGHRLGVFEQGSVVPSSTVLGAWQLVLLPAPGTHLLPLSTGRLRAIGYGAPSTAPDGLVPVPRAVSVLVAALARGLDAVLLALADALRTDHPPDNAVPISPGQFVSLDAGAAVTTDGGVCWVRVAGGHARRNGEDATVFGGAEPALLAGRDWLAVDGPATAEATTTADLLATGHLPAALDQHMVLTLRSIDRRLEPDD